MPRVLLIPGEARSVPLARALIAAGNPVRVVLRAGVDDPSSWEGAGAELRSGDPDRIATLMEALAAVTVVCWLMGDEGAPELHESRLAMLCAKLVDTPVRGLLYEAAGSAPAECFDRGRAVVEHAAATWSIPIAFVEDRADAAAAIEKLAGVR